MIRQKKNTRQSNRVFDKRSPLSFQSELNIEVININGEITLDYFEEWLSKTEQEMM